MLSKTLNVLVVDDDPSIRNMLSIVLKKENYNVYMAESGEKALENIRKNKIDMVISDIKMPGMSGIELLGRIKKIRKDIPVLMITAYTSTDDAIEAMKLGAEDYVSKPFNLEELKIVISKAFNKKNLENEIIDLRSKVRDINEFESIIGNNSRMMEIFELIETIAKTDSTILISGESGTGKELIAKAIHNKSNRANEKFISINCGALPENLLESELFGHKKGSFTDAFRDKKGLFLESDKGTLFLDEIGEMSQQMQVKLLRAIQERKIRPVGDNVEIPINSRIISATNKDLKERIDTGKFRSDLYYRLNVISIVVPPLRERVDDIPLLSVHFINKYNKRFNKNITGMDKDVIDILKKYSWPGNIRELENYFERAIALETTDHLSIGSIPEEIAFSYKKSYSFENQLESLIFEKDFDYTEYIEGIGKNILMHALQVNNFNLKKTSSMLKLSYRSLRYLISKYEISRRS